MATVLYPLQPKQQEFANSLAKFRLFGGAKGGGKSYAMRSEATRMANTAPMVRGLVLRRTSPEIRENMVIPMLRELPRELEGIGTFYTYNGTANEMRFFNGSTIRFSYCQNLKDVLRYQGIEYDFICIEELTHWSEREFQILRGCLRTSRAGIRPCFFASTNPGGVGHAWVKRLWIDRQFLPGERGEDFHFIPAKVTDNAVLMKTQPDYLADLEALPEILRRAYRDGDWDVFDGQFFTEFRRELHTCPATRVPNAEMRIVALDYGYKNPSAVYWLAREASGRVYAYRELYITGLTYRQLALRIQAMTPADEEIRAVVVDPAIVNKSSESTGTTGAQEFASV